MRNAAKAGGGTRQGRGFKYSMCGLRVGGKDGRLTAGCCWAMCPDGYLFPGFEMPDCESTRMTMLNILKWFEGREYYGREGHKFVFVYDDMCHLLRWALKRAHLHPEILRFTQASHAVDVFHFVHNHKGVWCDKMVNPFNVPALKGVNTEVCEQRFRHINKYAGMLRRMSRERFNWTLLTIVDMDHKFRAMRLTRSSIPQHARDAAISSVCTGLAGPHLGKGLATAARRVATELGQASASVQDRCDEALDSIHHAQFAVPNITACYKCEQLLQQAPAPRTGKPAWFYPGYGQAGVLGTEYRSTCATCTLVYDIEGYQLVSTAGTRLGVKLPLEPAHRHPDWVKVSSQTFIHTSFVEVYEAQLHTSHASFEKMTEAHNYMVESHLKQSGRAREERTLLYEKRLAAAVFRGQLLTTVDLLPLELRGNYNLKAQLNHLLDQVGCGGGCGRFRCVYGM
ncbi:hypothetical protein QJQ45_030350 [Haematococcus lacustris]|nr:hypothetical protein QJQ45_030350 [Haematococcus lacustris]